MSEFGGALDRWLEAPYVDAAREEADFEAWCEHTGTDPDADNARDLYADAMGAIEAAAEAELAAGPRAEDTEFYDGLYDQVPSDVPDTVWESDDLSKGAERPYRNTRRLL